MLVFLFEDDPSTSKLLQLYLLKLGERVMTFAEPSCCPVYGNDSCRCERTLPCADIIISDYHMPHMNGLELFLQQEARGCKSLAQNKLIISAGISQQEKEEILAHGYRYLEKPFRLELIATFIQECALRRDGALPS